MYSCRSFGFVTVDFGSFGSSARSGRGEEPGVDIVVEGKKGDLCAEELRESIDGFLGTLGDKGDRAGDPGRLISVSIDVGIGVLDGLWLMSNGMAGNGFGIVIGRGGSG